MIIANGNSRHTLTTISDGRTEPTLSIKLGGRSGKPKGNENEHRSPRNPNDIPISNIGGGDRADDPWDDEDGAQHAPTGEIAVQSERNAQSQNEREPRLTQASK